MGHFSESNNLGMWGSAQATAFGLDKLCFKASVAVSYAIVHSSSQVFLTKQELSISGAESVLSWSIPSADAAISA